MHGGWKKFPARQLTYSLCKTLAAAQAGVRLPRYLCQVARTRFFSPFTISFFAVILITGFRSSSDDPRTSYAATITAKDLRTHLTILASDEYEGRETAQKGQKMAAAYIAAQFKAAGIPGIPTSTDTGIAAYYQDVPLLQMHNGAGSIKTESKTYAFGEDFYYTSGTEDCDITTKEIVFAGYGIEDSLYKDYTGLDVNHKTVMVLSGEPMTADKKYSRLTKKEGLSTWSTQRRRKINEAKNRGAAALLIVVPDFAKAFSDASHSIFTPTLTVYDEVQVEVIYVQPMPVLYISKRMADEILRAGKTKKSIDRLSAKISKKGRPRSFIFAAPLAINIQRVGEIVHSENVLGYLEGSDLKNELIVVTAHYDHLGKDSNIVFNGADDDGSGTVAIIELAEAFAKAKKEGNGPRRSILFMTVTGEEKGLLGSKWYTSHPVFPLENTVCNLNIDMIGRIDAAHAGDTNYIYVIGSEMLSSELKTINEKANAQFVGLNLDYKFDDPKDPNMFYYRSDHYNFAKNNVPVAFYFNGVHADYHKETDEVQKINFPMMERRARLVFYTAWELVNRDKRIVVDKKKK
jgi:hypothetical protein